MHKFSPFFRFAIWLVLLVALLFALPQFISAQASSETITGEWHLLIEGKGGQGSTFYIMHFDPAGTLDVRKQDSGINTRDAAMTWTLENGILRIQPAPNSAMSELGSMEFTRVSATRFTTQHGDKTLPLNQRNVPLTLLHLLGVLIGLIFINEVGRKYRWVTILLFMVFPVVASFYWASSGNVTHLFRWVKLYSVVFAVVWFYFIRFTNLHKKRWALWICAAILSVNILEACTQDFAMGFLPNILNAIAGLLNIVVLSRWSAIQPDGSKSNDMLWPGMTTFWIIAYDIWNWTFVYLNFPEHASYHAIVLAACTIPSLFIKKGTWLQARAYTLATWMMYLFTFQPFIDSVIVPLPRTETLMLLAALLSIGSNLIYAVLHFRWVWTKKAPDWLQVGQSEVAYQVNKA